MSTHTGHQYFAGQWVTTPMGRGRIMGLHSHYADGCRYTIHFPRPGHPGGIASRDVAEGSILSVDPPQELGDQVRLPDGKLWIITAREDRDGEPPLFQLEREEGGCTFTAQAVPAAMTPA